MNTYRIFLLSMLSLCISCSSMSNESEQPQEWNLSKKGPPTAVELKPHTSNPLTFPPGTFPWQPKDTTIVVHTYLESLHHYPFNTNVQEIRDNHLNVRLVGYEINFPKDEIQKISKGVKVKTNKRTGDVIEPLWVSVDHPDFKVDNKMVFYEIKPFKYYKKQVRPTYNPLWKINNDLWVGANVSSMQGIRGLSFLIRKTKDSKAETFTTDENFPNGEPLVNDRWLGFLKSMVNPKTSEAITIYQWFPESNQISTRKLVPSYVKPSYKNDNATALFFVTPK